MTTDEDLIAMIHAVRPGGITAEKLAELTGAPVKTIEARLGLLETANRVTCYVGSGMRFWREPRT